MIVVFNLKKNKFIKKFLTLKIKLYLQLNQMQIESNVDCISIYLLFTKSKCGNNKIIFEYMQWILKVVSK